MTLVLKSQLKTNNILAFDEVVNTLPKQEKTDQTYYFLWRSD